MNEQTPTKQEAKTQDPKTPLEWFHWVEDFTDKLTLRRVFMLLMTGLLVSFTALMYENREQFFQAAVASLMNTSTISTWEPTETTQQQLKNLVRNSGTIKFAMVTEVDLEKNRRTPKFWYLDDPEEIFIRAKANTMLPQAVFDYDPKNTQQMVAVINNEFVCNKFSDTVYQRFFPDLGKRMPVICRLAIPPFYGRFVGIMTIGLRHPPSQEELDSIRLEASRLSVEIYLRDVIKKPAP